MISWIFYRVWFAEPFVRWLLYRLPNLKKKIKKNTKSKPIAKKAFDANGWEQYKSTVLADINNDDILLVHASMDGLDNLGVDEEIVFDFLKSLVEKGCTVVCTAFPITNLKDKDHKMKAYNPEITPCWTGMLSNRFISEPGVIRSAVPYNSLAAMGPKAAEMMQDNIQAEYVYGDHTPWKYLVEHHAKILFIGTTSVDSNTIQTHMLADYMGPQWPIDNWYEQFECPVKINGEKIEKKLNIQSVFWTQYVMDYATTRKLEKNGYLRKYDINGCPFEIVADSKAMLDYLAAECKKGKLTYLIPKKYWRNR
ncbi:MAG: AAC(3) family N-acetyltransferase [Pseudobutyrivibrio sp.]|nr:AAC(3) family N-acetyltransferase [Pseudobutyrivibrio sp.]